MRFKADYVETLSLMTCSDGTSLLKQLQDDLVNSVQTLEYVMYHINHSQDRIAIQVMQFLSVLVCNGNAKAQKAICHYLKDTELFSRMELLFENTTMNLR